uniref:ribosomal protein L5 n=1 Tax=Prototheca tumulicola TaxID=1737639 RepID=UPI00300398D0
MLEIKTKQKDTRLLKIKKIDVHCGIGRYKTSPEIIEFFYEQLSIITGQKPRMTYAKRPIAGFNLREKMPLGFYVTLRKQRMISFYNRLITVILPQTYNFQGLKIDQFDGLGNLTLAVKSIFNFHECNSKKFYEYTKIGLNISIVTSFKTDDEAIQYLNKYGMLLKKKGL